MKNDIIIDKDIRRMAYTISIPRECINRAFTSQEEYNNLITDLSKSIYDYALKHGYINK